MGLMMAATLAELNGARVSLTDNSTRGATFTLTFSLKSRHVVVVEPDPLFRAELVTALQDGGWEVSALHDGAGFKETFSGLSRPPAAVITELILPGAGARSLVSDITADMPGVPIFAVTSLALPEAIDGFKKLGISEVLSKLLLKEELLKRLTAHLEEDL